MCSETRIYIHTVGTSIDMCRSLSLRHMKKRGVLFGVWATLLPTEWLGRFCRFEMACVNLRDGFMRFGVELLQKPDVQTSRSRRVLEETLRNPQDIKGIPFISKAVNAVQDQTAHARHSQRVLNPCARAKSSRAGRTGQPSARAKTSSKRQCLFPLHFQTYHLPSFVGRVLPLFNLGHVHLRLWLYSKQISLTCDK